MAPFVTKLVAATVIYLALFRDYSFSSTLYDFSIYNSTTSAQDVTTHLDLAFATLKRFETWSQWNSFTYNVQLVEDVAGAPPGELSPGQRVGFTVNLLSPFFDHTYSELDLEVCGDFCFARCCCTTRLFAFQP